MEEIEELIRQYNLEEDSEHIIIPLPEKEGRARRCFILKRNFLIIQFPDGHFSDFPLAEIIEATVKYPELLLSESIHYVHKTPEISSIMEHSENENKVMIKENDEKENID